MQFSHTLNAMPKSSKSTSEEGARVHQVGNVNVLSIDHMNILLTSKDVRVAPRKAC